MESQRTLELPCAVGETVFCNIDDHPEDFLDECYVKSVEIEKDFPHDGECDPLYTVICNNPYKKEYQRFFASDFGKTVFTTEQYFALPKDAGKKKPKLKRRPKQIKEEK